MKRHFIDEKSLHFFKYIIHRLAKKFYRLGYDEAKKEKEARRTDIDRGNAELYLKEVNFQEYVDSKS